MKRFSFAVDQINRGNYQINQLPRDPSFYTLLHFARREKIRDLLSIIVRDGNIAPPMNNSPLILTQVKQAHATGQQFLHLTTMNEEDVRAMRNAGRLLFAIADELKEKDEPPSGWNGRH